jgi:1-acyl-sn-glycerol-3-phosphate acyltransferase
MRWSERLVNAIVRFLTGVACRVDEAPLRSLPPRGPLILVANHINFLEAPLVYVRVRPRPATGFAKVEWWDNPFMGWLFTLWGAIPLRRGEGDVEAFRQALRALEQGSIVALSPEGTRSGSGRLLRAQPGTAMLALRSGAPILPLAFFGHIDVWRNLKRLRRTDFHVAVGKMFRVRPVSGRVTREIRQAIADEIMIQIARLLPQPYRGEYAARVADEPVHLEFVPSGTGMVG